MIEWMPASYVCGYRVTWMARRMSLNRFELRVGPRESGLNWGDSESFGKDNCADLKITVGPCALSMPLGLGALTVSLVEGEVCDWKRFLHRKAVDSYTGLCPSEHSSGGVQRFGAIDRHGNKHLRTLLVEAVWRLLRWQPAWHARQKYLEKPCESIQPSWKLQKEKTKPEKTRSALLPRLTTLIGVSSIG